MTHTKGPWRVDHAGDIVSGPHNVCIPFATKPEDKRLMAAAPMLLDQLERALDILETFDGTAATCRCIRKTIASARQESAS